MSVFTSSFAPHPATASSSCPPWLLLQASRGHAAVSCQAAPSSWSPRGRQPLGRASSVSIPDHTVPAQEPSHPRAVPPARLRDRLLSAGPGACGLDEACRGMWRWLGPMGCSRPPASARVPGVLCPAASLLPPCSESCPRGPLAPTREAFPEYSLSLRSSGVCQLRWALPARFWPRSLLALGLQSGRAGARSASCAAPGPAVMGCGDRRPGTALTQLLWLQLPVFCLQMWNFLCVPLRHVCASFLQTTSFKIATVDPSCFFNHSV